MMSVALASLGEGASIAVRPIAAEYARWLAFFADTIAPEILQVRR
jgi:hypothetical protein